MEGKMFGPLAMTIAIALFVSLVLSLTLSPVMCSYILKGGSGEDTRFIQAIKKPYLRLLNLAISNERKTIGVAVVAFAIALGTIPLLGTSFIPEMQEGSIVPNIIRAPNISLDESIKMEKEALQVISKLPGVKSVVSGVGRGESPADPQSQNESQPIVSLLPRDRWPDGWTQEDIKDSIQNSLKVLPGVQVVMAQPIAARVAELLSGVRSDVAVKLFGDDMLLLKAKADEIAKIAGSVPGAVDMRVEKVSGQQYLNITIDRHEISRHGINAADVHDVIETAIGGKVATEVYEGQRRFSAAVRYPENFRSNVEDFSSSFSSLAILTLAV
jgi:cobalt-zinc-cadmium resistance protein CzcA